MAWARVSENRIIYGPEYSLPDILERLPSRCDEADCGEFVAVRVAGIEDVGRAKSHSR
jgi:hypothetical protein